MNINMIWCVEDDASIRDIEIYTLLSTGFEAKGFDDGKAAWEALKLEKPELILLDVMLPGMDGVELLKRIKESATLCDIPVIMATAKGSEYDKIKSLDMGADDYLVKPFSMMEMVSRIKAVLRRCKPKQKATLLKIKELTLNPEERTVFIRKEKIALTYKEFELLYLFISHPGKVYTRDVLYNEIWGSDYIGESRTVDMHIRTLRQKLGEYGELIETIRNVGYRMETQG